MKNLDDGYFEGGLHSAQSKKTLDHNKNRQRRNDEQSLRRYVRQGSYQARELRDTEEPKYKP